MKVVYGTEEWVTCILITLSMSAKEKQSDKFQRSQNQPTLYASIANKESKQRQKNHPLDQIIGNKDAGVETRRKIRSPEQTHLALLSTIEPNCFEEANKDEFWNKAMDEELDQIEKIDTWELVPRPKDKNEIDTKWVYMNKLNEDGHVTRNKARLVCKGYAQIEGIQNGSNPFAFILCMFQKC